MKNVYNDKETGLTIRRINYDSKDDVFIDIKVIGDCWSFRKTLNLSSILPEKITLFEEIGRSHRESHQKNLEVFAVLNGIGIISTCGVIIKDGFPYMHIGVLENFKEKYNDITHALARMLKENYSKVFYIHPIGMNKEGLKLKKFIGYYPDEHQIEVWELNV